jgi:hypothetical protein
MPMEVYFVLCMSWNMVHSVVLKAVLIKKWLRHRHVLNMRENGDDIKAIITIKNCLAFDGWCTDQVKDCHGSLLLVQIYNLMMKKQLKFRGQTTLHHNDSIVWRQFVLPVVWSLPGPSLQMQSHQPISCNFWRQLILLKNHGQIISVLTRAVSCFVQPFQMAVGRCGRKPANLLWTPIITTTTVSLISYAGNTVTLPCKMVQHQIWLLLNIMIKADHITSRLSIHKHVNNSMHG